MNGKIREFIKSNRCLSWLYGFLRNFRNYLIIQIVLLNSKGKNNKISNNGKTTRCKYDIRGNNNQIYIGKGAYICDFTFHIRGDNNTIIIGDNCVILGESAWCEGYFLKIQIGKKTTVVSAHFCAQERDNEIVLGEDCLLSNSIIIRTSDSHPYYDLEGKRLNSPGSIKIGDHVWICAKATIMKNVSIGTGSVIGYQSVVTRNISEYSVAVGSPAKTIKEGIKWTRESLFPT